MKNINKELKQQLVYDLGEEVIYQCEGVFANTVSEKITDEVFNYVADYMWNAMINNVRRHTRLIIDQMNEKD